MSLKQFVLVSQTSRVGMKELNRVAAAIQRQLIEELPNAWGLSASVRAVERVQDTPLGAAPIIVVDAAWQNPGSFGFHRVLANDPNRLDDDQPYAVVRYDPQLWSLDASHECLEMVLNPFGNTMVRAPSIEANRHVDYLVEICDPCGRAEAAYFIDGVLVSDFVTRAYFAAAGVGRYTAQDRLTSPRGLQPGGYLAWAEIAASGVLGAGPWQMLIYGQAPVPIDRPDIYASIREGVDYQSHAFTEAQAKKDREVLRKELRRRKTQEMEIRAKQKRHVANIKRHITKLRMRATRAPELAKFLRPKRRRRPSGELTNAEKVLPVALDLAR